MTGAPIDISVVVCTYNRSASLARTLESLRSQVVPPGVTWEVIVVDNNSTDATLDVVRRFADAAGPVFRGIREEKQGLSNARNRGVTEARGGYIAFTDDDVLVPPEWVAVLLSTFEIGGWDGIGGRVRLKAETKMPRWLKKELWGFLACLDYGDEEIALSDPKRPFFGANMVFRRDVFDRLGLFDPELGRRGKRLVGGEETDLFERMVKSGMRIEYQPKAEVQHVVDPARFRKKYFRGLHYSSGWIEGTRYEYRGRQVAGIPGFVVLHVFRSVGIYLREGLREGFHNAFRKEMNIWYFLGFMAGRVRNRFAERRPA